MTTTLEPAAEVGCWCGDVAALLDRLNGTDTAQGPGPLPPDCAGDGDDEGSLLLGLLKGAGIDPADIHAAAHLERSLEPRAALRGRQELANLADALRAAQRRLLALADQEQGPLCLPQKYQLYTDPYAPAAALEALLQVLELPAGHRLRDLLPREELISGKYLALGDWQLDFLRRRLPPKAIALAEVKRRTRLLARGEQP